MAEDLLTKAVADVVAGTKLPPAQYSALYSWVYAETNSIDDGTLNCFCDKLEFAVLNALRNKASLLTKGANTAQAVDLFEAAKRVDVLINRLLVGRKYFLSSFSHATSLASSTVQCIIEDSQALLQVVAHLRESHPKCSDAACLVCPALRIIDASRLGYGIEFDDSVQPYSQHLVASSKVAPFPRSRFTRTKNVIRPLPEALFFHPSHEHAASIKKIDLNIPNVDKVAFVLENLLSEEECQRLIADSQATGYKTLKYEFIPTMRDNNRVLLMSNKLSAEIWKRVKPFVESDPRTASLRPFGFNSWGKWRPCGINPLFRFCEYVAPAVGFAPHKDANFVKDEDHRSTMTIMVYLNDQFEGGSTNFLRSHTGGRKDETISEELARGYEVAYELKPKPGMAVVFEHSILHEGAPVSTGQKYLCRSDVVYERYQNTRPGDASWKKNPEFARMVQMYKDAAEWECKGRVDLSSQLYERALSLRQNQPVEEV